MIRWPPASHAWLVSPRGPRKVAVIAHHPPDDVIVADGEGTVTVSPACLYETETEAATAMPPWARNTASGERTEDLVIDDTEVSSEDVDRFKRETWDPLVRKLMERRKTP